MSSLGGTSCSAFEKVDLATLSFHVPTIGSAAQAGSATQIEGGRMELAQHGIEEGGVTITFRITFPAQGGLVKVNEDSYAEVTEGLTFFETRVGPGNWYVTTMRGGKQVMLRHKVVSADGKTKREIVRGTDERGEEFEQIEIYERIQP